MCQNGFLIGRLLRPRLLLLALAVWMECPVVSQGQVLQQNPQSYPPIPFRSDYAPPVPPDVDQSGDAEIDERSSLRPNSMSADASSNRNGADNNASDEQSLQADLDEDYVSDDDFEAANADDVARDLEIGEPTTDYTKSFLRTQTPLLGKGRSQVDFGIRYSVFEADFPTITNATLTEANITSRRIETPLGFRYGLTERLQFFAAMPVGWQETEIADGFSERTQSVGGVGDLTLGFNQLLRAETAAKPSIIATFDVTAPTGNDANPLFLSDSGLGSGAWATSTRLLMVKTYDPVVIFWGGGYRFNFEDTYSGNDIDLGDQILYSLGIGFAANERVTLSTTYNGGYVTDLKLNGNTLAGTGFDLGSVRMAATTVNCRKITEPFVEFGVTNRSPAVSFGILFTR